jgi:hypothetical protein
VDHDSEKVAFTEEIQPEASRLLLEWHKVQWQRFHTVNLKKFEAVTNQVAMMKKACNIAKDLGLDWKPSN